MTTAQPHRRPSRDDPPPRHLPLPPSSPSSQREVERELSAVRSLRRRSGSLGGAGGPPGFELDPDLPVPTMTAAQSTLEVADLGPMSIGSGGGAGAGGGAGGAGGGGTAAAGGTGGAAGNGILARSPSSDAAARLIKRTSSRRDVSGSSEGGGGGEDEDADDAAVNEDEAVSTLFWVPANLHPELAPGEFRAFLKEHAHAHVQQAAAAVSSGGSLSSAPSFLSSTTSPDGTTLPFQDAKSNVGGGSLGRKKSMLSRQYTPRAGDGVENEPPIRTLSLSRSRSSRSSIYSSPKGTDEDPGVSLSDLQRLEELADEAAKSDDPGKLRSMLKRTWSINGGSDAASIDSIDGVKFDENDAPIISTRAGSPSLIRRTARTKIRKAGNDGDASHFGPSRRGRTAHLTGFNLAGEPAAMSTSPTAEDDTVDGLSGQLRRTALSDEGFLPPTTTAGSGEAGSEGYRPVSMAESLDETSIYDAYRRDSLISGQPLSSPLYSSGDEAAIFSTTSSADVDAAELASAESSESSASPPTSSDAHGSTTSIPSGTSSSQQHAVGQDEIESESEENAADALTERSPTSTTPTQEKQLSLGGPPTATSLAASRSDTSLVLPSDEAAYQRQQQLASSSPPPELPAPASSIQSPSANQIRMERGNSASSSAGSSIYKEKEKKGGFFSSKKDKDKKKEKTGKPEKEKGFFGSLLGGKKKAQDDETRTPVNSEGGRAAATALLQSKSSKPTGVVASPHQPGTPAPTSGHYSNFARYPIHVERAVYRLSHIKLANPRRPLYEQVLISNLMFWYLSVINKTAQGPAAIKAAEEAKKKAGEEEATVAAEGGPTVDAEEATAAAAATEAAARAAAVTSNGSKGTPSGVSSKNAYLNGLALVTSSSLSSSGPPQQPALASAAASSPPAKRTSLTKKEPAAGAGGGRPSGARAAEMPVRTPQYGVQNAQLDKEYAPSTSSREREREREGSRDRGDQRPLPQTQQQQHQYSQQHQHQQYPHHQSPQSYPQSKSPPPSQQRVVSPEAARERPRLDRQGPPPMYGSSGGGGGSSPTSPPNGYPYGGGGGGPPPHPHQHHLFSSSSSSGGHSSSNGGVAVRRSPSEQRDLGSPHPPRPSNSTDAGSSGGGGGGEHQRPRARSSSRPSPGPQPGQVFQHSSSSGGIRPGEVFNPSLIPQIGQVFHHSLHQPYGRPPAGPPVPNPYGPPPPHGYQQRPGLPPGPHMQQQRPPPSPNGQYSGYPPQGYPHLMPQQQQHHPHQQQLPPQQGGYYGGPPAMQQRPRSGERQPGQQPIGGGGSGGDPRR